MAEVLQAKKLKVESELVPVKSKDFLNKSLLNDNLQAAADGIVVETMKDG